MTAAPWRVLVINAREDEQALRASRADFEAARASASTPPPAIEPRFLLHGDPDIPAALRWADVLLGWRLPRDLIAQNGQGLRLIQLINAGIDPLLPLDWLPEGAILCNASGIHGPKLQEWAVMVLLMLHAQMPYFATAQREGLWSRRTTPLIAGRTVLVFGTGGLGSAVARAGHQLGLATIGVKREVAPVGDFDSVVSLDGAFEALPRADFVVLTLPLTPATRGLADAAFFAALRPGAGFANFGRGALVDQAALCAALEAGTPGGAILDVTNPEPLPSDSPLWRAKNLIITPHVSCDDPETYIADSVHLLLDNLARLGDGRALRNRIDPAKGY
jgi:phosphoglycerate dehydrogenase-like enzyme